MKNFVLALAIAFSFVVFSCLGAEGELAKIDVQRSEADYSRAKEVASLEFGMFICWSFSTFSGQEWTPTLDKDASYFRATGLDTDQWVRTAKEAGMKYILFLTKHHDGFCLWDTKTTEKKVTNSTLGVDVLAELRKSCDKYGIKLALYFSEGDWNWPGAYDGDGHWKGSGINPEVKKAQLEELLTNYGDIEFFWMDYAAGDGGLSHDLTTAWVHSFQPDTFVGYNHGEPSGRIILRERGSAGPLGGDHSNWIADQSLNEKIYNGYLVAEFTYPILPAHVGGADWFYSLPEHDNLVHSAEKIYTDYLQAVKYGNIFSLNVGPDYEGKLRDVDVETLQRVGEMIRQEEDFPAYKVTPTANQLEWQNTEYYGLVCFGLNTYTQEEWAFGNLSPSLFDPENLDTDQWARVARDSGMKGLILVAKHHDGFCLWQTESTEYSVAASPWKGGEGDVVDDLYNSCKKYGLKFGIYISPWDRNHAEYGRPGYVEVFHKQWEELLTRYGSDLFEVWLDGANGGDGWYGGANETRSIPDGYYQLDKVYEMVERLAPNAVIFGGNNKDSVRWVGNERGYAGKTNWSRFDAAEFSYNTQKELESGCPNGKDWRPAEADVPLLSRHHWYYHENERPKSFKILKDIWYKTIGRNATLNLGLAISPEGIIRSEDEKSLLELKSWVDKKFSTQIRPVFVRADNLRGAQSYEENLFDGSRETYWATADGVRSATLLFDFGKKISIGNIILQEPIQLGQRISRFTIERKNSFGRWVIVSTETTIGYKRILNFRNLKSSQLRIRLETEASYIAISGIEFYTKN
ncbi:MAG: alpha-L-fucosidase [Spirochaetales bacterium]|nr:alpha-L-fucosidase [Spirochaetales bacterium]